MPKLKIDAKNNYYDKLKLRAVNLSPIEAERRRESLMKKHRKPVTLAKINLGDDDDSGN